MVERRPVASVLFAAGRGVRLKPITDVIPKAALPLLDVPVAAWPLSRLATLGAPVLVNVSHGHGAVADALAPFGDIEVSLELPEPYGTAGTLAAARSLFGERVVTCNADQVSDIEPGDVLQTHGRLGAPATAAVRMVDRGADLIVDGERAVSYVDRRRREPMPGAQFIGMAVFERRVLEDLSDERPLGLAEVLLRLLVERRQLAVHVHSGYWRDVGTPGDYLRGSLDLLEGNAPPPPVPWPGTISEGEGGRSYVGPGACVNGASLGAGAVLLRSCNVGRGARISSSVVLPDEAVPPGATLEGCIWAGGSAVAT